MLFRLSSIALTAGLLTTGSLVSTIVASEIPTDVPVSSLLQTASKFLAAGNFNQALEYFDVAVSRDPQNYLTLFKRGAAYLSLGRSYQAVKDFDKVLEIKPGFEGALTQRAKIRAKAGEWSAATADYKAVPGGEQKFSADIAELEEAQGASVLAEEASKKGDWEACVTNAGTAIRIASQLPKLRRLRAECRLERGEVPEAIGDLQHLLVLIPQVLDPHLQASALLYYSVGDSERALTQIRKCIHSDPESKPCKKALRRMKQIDKSIKKLEDLKEKKQWTMAGKLLAGSKGEPGLIEDVRGDIKQLKEEGTINDKAPLNVLTSLLETACEAFTENKNRKNAAEYCAELGEVSPASIPFVIFKAQKLITEESYEEAIRLLTEAQENGGQQNNKINELLNDAHLQLKKSKQKDYYKVLGVDREADDRTIKRAYRNLIKIHHPDKAHAQGLSKEEAEKKMAAINEAYEVLSDPELRRRFDNGDDPNNPEQQQGGNPFQGSPFGGGHQQFVFRQGGGGGFPGGAFKFPQGGFQFQGGF